MAHRLLLADIRFGWHRLSRKWRDDELARLGEPHVAVSPRKHGVEVAQSQLQL